MGSSCSLKKWWHAPLSVFPSPVLWSPLSARSSVSPAFMLKRGPHTLTRTKTLAPSAAVHCNATYSQALYTATHTKKREKKRQPYAQSPNQSISVIQTSPLLPWHHLSAAHLPRRDDRGHRRGQIKENVNTVTERVAESGSKKRGTCREKCNSQKKSKKKNKKMPHLRQHKRFSFFLWLKSAAF